MHGSRFDNNLKIKNRIQRVKLTGKCYAGVVVKEETVAQLDDGPMQWKKD
jgi:hypothetical protein